METFNIVSNWKKEEKEKEKTINLYEESLILSASAMCRL